MAKVEIGSISHKVLGFLYTCAEPRVAYSHRVGVGVARREEKK